MLDLSKILACLMLKQNMTTETQEGQQVISAIPEPSGQFRQLRLGQGCQEGVW